MVLLEILGEVKRGGNGKGRGRLAHDRELCTLCGGCAPRCPAGALTVRETYLVIDEEKCTACGACAPGCPTGALKLEVERDAPHFTNLAARSKWARFAKGGPKVLRISAGRVRLRGVGTPDLSPGSSGQAERDPR